MFCFEPQSLFFDFSTALGAEQSKPTAIRCCIQISEEDAGKTEWLLPKPIESEPFMIFSFLQVSVNILQVRNKQLINEPSFQLMFGPSLVQEKLTPKGHLQQASSHHLCLHK